MRWYHKPVVIILAILMVGPLALPLVWMTPVFKKWQKVTATILVVLITIWLFKATIDLYRILLSEMKSIEDILKR